MIDSILNSTKKVLGIAADYNNFDEDILMHINTAFSSLQQIGIGPPEGFTVEDSRVDWEEFLGNDAVLNSVKTYVYLRVRLLFDPPGTSFHINAAEEQLREIEWRLSTYKEGGV